MPVWISRFNLCGFVDGRMLPVVCFRLVMRHDSGLDGGKIRLLVWNITGRNDDIGRQEMTTVLGQEHQEAFISL